MVSGITDDIKQQADAALAASWRPGMKKEPEYSEQPPETAMGTATEPVLAIRNEDWSQQFFTANSNAAQARKVPILAKNDDAGNQSDLEFTRAQAIDELNRLLSNTSDSTLRTQIYAAIAQISTASSTKDIENLVTGATAVAGQDNNGPQTPTQKMAQLQNDIVRLNKESDDLFQQMQDNGIAFDEKDEKERERLHQWLKDHPGDKEAQKSLDVLEKKMLADVDPQLPDHPNAVPIHRKALENVIQRAQDEKEQEELQKLTAHGNQTKQEQKGEEKLGKAETSMHMSDDDDMPTASTQQGKDVTLNDVAAQNVGQKPITPKGTSRS